MDYRILRSKRKSISAEITESGEILVRAPRNMSDADIAAFVGKNEDWLLAQLYKYEKRQEVYRTLKPFSKDELNRMRAQAKAYFPERAAHFAGHLHVDYGAVSIRLMKSRWGSCAGNGNLSFNLLLMEAPGEVRDYVVIHELCHRVEMNHSRRFWALVESVMPDYQERRRWLNNHGDLIVQRAYAKNTDAKETHYVYMLMCADGSFYIGYTPNLRTRLQAHNAGRGAKYTRARLPVKLVYYEEFSTKTEAMSREALLKQLTHQEKEKLIKAVDSKGSLIIK